MTRLSGDQKGKLAPSVPATGLAVSESTWRTNSDVFPEASAATNARAEPSGETAAIAPRRVPAAKAVPSGARISKRATAGGSARSQYHPMAAAAVVTSNTRLAICQAAGAPRFAAGRVMAGNASATGPSSMKRTTEKSETRSRRSFTRQREATVTRRGGASAGIMVQSGSVLMMAAMISVVSRPSNARTPASIWYSTQPNAQTSLRLSTAFPRACSGLM